MKLNIAAKANLFLVCSRILFLTWLHPVEFCCSFYFILNVCLQKKLIISRFVTGARLARLWHVHHFLMFYKMIWTGIFWILRLLPGNLWLSTEHVALSWQTSHWGPRAAAFGKIRKLGITLSECLLGLVFAHIPGMLLTGCTRLNQHYICMTRTGTLFGKIHLVCPGKEIPVNTATRYVCLEFLFFLLF